MEKRVFVGFFWFRIHQQDQKKFHLIYVKNLIFFCVCEICLQFYLLDICIILCRIWMFCNSMIIETKNTENCIYYVDDIFLGYFEMLAKNRGAIRNYVNLLFGRIDARTNSFLDGFAKFFSDGKI